ESVESDPMANILAIAKVVSLSFQLAACRALLDRRKNGTAIAFPPGDTTPSEGPNRLTSCPSDRGAEVLAGDRRHAWLSRARVRAYWEARFPPRNSPPCRSSA